MGKGNSGFVNNKCKYTNCFTTNNRSDLYLPDTRVDAVVVQGLISQALNNKFKFGHTIGMQNMVSLLFYSDDLWSNDK